VLLLGVWKERWGGGRRRRKKERGVGSKIRVLASPSTHASI
jgi:hypothetical protein